MTQEEYLRQQKSHGKSSISRRWNVDTKKLLETYDFSFLHAHASGGKCDFCGNPLTYVAVIEGKEVNHPDTGIYVTQEIGFDCLQIVFGRNWNDFYKAKKEVDKLKAEVARQKRVEENKEKFGDIIQWFENLHPEYISSNNFLTDMQRILLTGEKIFSINMEGAIRKNMAKPVMSKEEYEVKLKHFKEKTLPRLKEIYDLVVEVDKIDLDNPPIGKVRFSSYDFVKSVYFRALSINKVSSAQLDRMNEVYNRYIAKQEKSQASQNTINTDDLPF